MFTSTCNNISLSYDSDYSHQRGTTIATPMHPHNVDVNTRPPLACCNQGVHFKLAINGSKLTFRCHAFWLVFAVYQVFGNPKTQNPKTCS